MAINLSRMHELETRLMREQEAVKELIAKAALVNSEHWQFIDDYIMREMWRVTEAEEGVSEIWQMHRYVGVRAGLRKILDFEKDIKSLTTRQDNVKKLQEAYQEAIK